MKKILSSRYALLFALISFYLLSSFAVRLTLYFSSFSSMDFSILSIVKIFSLGFYFDLAVAFYIFLFYAIYLLLIPIKLIGTLFDKILTYFIVSISLIVSVFSFISEFPFWDEFNTRFNFIAVDYLIYTYEVIGNINESYSIPLVIAVLASIILGIIYFFKRKNIFDATFTDKLKLSRRFTYFFPVIASVLFFSNFSTNKQAEWSSNLYENELSKNGVYSFFAAYRSNELDYNTFYEKMDDEKAFEIVKQELLQDNQTYTSNDPFSVNRQVTGSIESTPNIIMICIESLSADFLETFGNKEHLTPVYDSLAKNSIFFSNMYATGTRTIRGMEALTLCVPPTPGNSIVRRPNNNHLFSIATILKERNYNLDFIYGGDGYFDNMNNFFGGQGFNIIDRDRGNPLSENIETERTAIQDQDVTFENAWGVCDEDIYKQSLLAADENAKNGKAFFQFIMTTSNHKPYSFPEHKIDLPQGHREGAVKYTDYAIGEFLKKAQSKSWYKNTVFVIVADHCASSAGKWEVNIEKHHIPALIYNLPHKNGTINLLASQIDLMPTLFGYLGWTYNTQLYGKDINHMKPEDERVVLGNYRTVGMLRNHIFTEINDRKKSYQYAWNDLKKSMTKFDKIKDDTLKNLTIAYYQTASYNFKHGLMKEKSK